MGFAKDIVSDRVAPPFLQGPWATAWLTAQGQGMDAIQARLYAARRMSLPGVGDASALPYLGLDRVLTQGANESNAAFGARLSAAFDTWQRAGNAWSIFQQLQAFFTPTVLPMTIVSNSSAWDYYAAGVVAATTPPTHLVSLVPNWNWDNDAVDPHPLSPTSWWRWWLVLFSYAPNAWATIQAPLGSGRKLGDNPTTSSLGFANIGPQFWIALRQAIAPFKSANSWLRWIIICFDNAHFQPNSPTAGGVNPDGTFGYGYKIVSGVYVSSRFSGERYVTGVL